MTQIRLCPYASKGVGVMTQKVYILPSFAFGGCCLKRFPDQNLFWQHLLRLTLVRKVEGPPRANAKIKLKTPTFFAISTQI